jgi:hypothetical protein
LPEEAQGIDQQLGSPPSIKRWRQRLFGELFTCGIANDWQMGIAGRSKAKAALQPQLTRR